MSENEINGDMESFEEAIKNYNKLNASLTQMKSFETFQDCLNNLSQDVSKCEANKIRIENSIQKYKDTSNTNNQSEKDELYIKSIERLYGLEVVKLKDNNLKFLFSGMYEKSESEKCWVTFCLKNSKWMFSESNPKIIIDNEIEILNKDHNLTVFLSSVRNKFKKIINYI